MKYLVMFWLSVVLFLPGMAYPKALINITGSSTVLPIIRDLAVQFEKTSGVVVKVSGGGSEKGLSDVSSGRSDIAMVSRKLTNAEKRKLNATVIAYDGVAVIINSSNRINQISKQQIIDIFQGSLSNWSELGGEDQPIAVYSKANNRATRHVFDRYFGIADISPKSEIVGSNAEMLVLVGINPGAIGYVSIGAIEEAQESGVLIKPLLLDAVQPIHEQEKSGGYSLSRPLNLVTKKKMNSVIKRFVKYVRSKSGQTVINKHNFIFAN